MSYDIGDGYYVDDDGNIQRYASESTSDYTDTSNNASSDTFSGFNLADIGKLLSGTSSLGMAGQLAGLGGVGSLLNKMLGGGGSGGFAGYKGSIPQYTAQRTQYAVPTTGVPSTYKPSDSEIRDYALRPGINDAMVARGMNEFNISPERMAGIMQIPTEQVQSRYQAAMGPNYVARRPGSGGVTYFSPMQYNLVPTVAPTTAPTTVPTTVATTPTTQPTVIAAGGGMMRGGIASLGGYSDGGQLLRGPGDGVSDDIPATIGDKQPARLADGEFVVPARIVSELGNGSTEAGARKLYAMMDRIKKTRSKAKNIAANTKADKHLPA
jgi:hypothetical protein